jgi:acetyl-CoA acyltransferase
MLSNIPRQKMGWVARWEILGGIIMNDRDVVLVEGVRTPFAKAGGKLKTIHPAELGRVAVQQLLALSNMDVNQIDEVIMGNTGNPPDTVNISRVIALRSGIPLNVPAYTVHRNCASALESITSASDKIRAGSADVVVAGGTENMSQLPILMSPKQTAVIE